MHISMCLNIRTYIRRRRVGEEALLVCKCLSNFSRSLSLLFSWCVYAHVYVCVCVCVCACVRVHARAHARV